MSRIDNDLNDLHMFLQEELIQALYTFISQKKADKEVLFGFSILKVERTEDGNVSAVVWHDKANELNRLILRGVELNQIGLIH